MELQVGEKGGATERETPVFVSRNEPHRVTAATRERETCCESNRETFILWWCYFPPLPAMVPPSRNIEATRAQEASTGLAVRNPSLGAMLHGLGNSPLSLTRRSLLLLPTTSLIELGTSQL